VPRSPLQPSDALSSEKCLSEVLEVFADISHDHVKQLYDHEAQLGRLDNTAPSAVHNVIEKILENGKYPKEKDRLNELKRKRSRNNDEEELAELRSGEGAKALEGFMDCVDVGHPSIHPYHKIS